MIIELAAKTLVICQLQEMPIPLRQSKISRLYYFSLEHPNKRKTN